MPDGPPLALSIRVTARVSTGGRPAEGGAPRSGSEGPARAGHVALQGDLRGERAAGLLASVEDAGASSASSTVVVDFEADARVDSATVAALLMARRRLSERDVALQVGDLSPPQRAAFAMVPAPDVDDEAAPERERRLARVGYATAERLDVARRYTKLVGRTARYLGRALTGRGELRFSAVVDQSVRMGIDAIWLVMALSGILGLVLSLQSYGQLERFGAEVFTADIVGVGMVREFGPILTGMIFAGRNATSIAAEIGTMSVREELDALRTMGVDPIEILIVPRTLALLLVQPLLTIFSMAAGITGGVVFAAIIGLSGHAYIDRLAEAITFGDLISGLTKSVLFAVIVATAGAFMGLRTQGGATAVGRSTTVAVVTSIALIVVVDSIATAVTVWVGNG